MSPYLLGVVHWGLRRALLCVVAVVLARRRPAVVGSRPLTAPLYVVRADPEGGSFVRAWWAGAKVLLAKEAQRAGTPTVATEVSPYLAQAMKLGDQREIRGPLLLPAGDAGVVPPDDHLARRGVRERAGRVRGPGQCVAARLRRRTNQGPWLRGPTCPRQVRPRTHGYDAARSGAARLSR